VGINRTAHYIKNTLYCYHHRRGQDFGSISKYECYAVHFICVSVVKSAEYTIIQYLFSWILCNWQSLNYKVFLDTFNVLDFTLQCRNTFCCLLMACAPNRIMLRMCEFYKSANNLLLRYLASITLKIWIQTLYKSCFRFKNADKSWLVTRMRFVLMKRWLGQSTIVFIGTSTSEHT